MRQFGSRTSSRRRFLRTVGVAPAFGLADVESYLTTPRPSTRWQFETGANHVKLAGLFRDQSPVVTDTVVAGTENTVYGLDRERGTERWRFSPDADDFWPEVGPDTVYVKGDGELYVLDAAEGTERVEFVPSDESLLNVEATDLRGAYVRTGEALYALDAHGGIRWRVEGDFTDAVVDRGTVYALTSGFGAKVYALDPGNGSEQWRATLDDPGHGEVVGTDADTVYVHVQGYLYAFDAEGRRRWKRLVRSADGDSLRLVGTVTSRGPYVWDEETGLLRALDPVDGRERWRFDADSDPRPGGLLAEAGGTLYAGTERRIHAFDPVWGDRRWTYERDSDAGFLARLAHGRIYTVVGDGSVVALDAGTGERVWKFSPLRGRLIYGVPGPTGYGPNDRTLYAVSTEGSVFALEGPARTPPAALADAAEENAGLLALGGAVGGGLLAAARRFRGDEDADSASDPGTDSSVDLELVELLDTEGPLETHRSRWHRAGGAEAVVVRRLTEAADERTASEFARAARAWATLDHEGIRPLLEVEADARRIVLPPADGTVTENVADVPERIRAVAAACEAVHAAHRSGVVHGRLAPDCIHVPGDEFGGERADVWVGGWTRKAATDPDGALAAPEAESETVAGDVYRLGAVAYDLSAGRAPPVESDDVAPEDFDADCRDALADVLSRALAPDPADRYDSALKLADALRWAVHDRQRRRTAT